MRLRPQLRCRYNCFSKHRQCAPEDPESSGYRRRICDMVIDLGEPIVVVERPVVVYFIGYPKSDEYRHRHTCRQTADVDRGDCPGGAKVSNSDRKVVLQQTQSRMKIFSPQI